MNDNMNNLLREFSNFNVGDKTYSFNGKPVPRVTKILSRCIHSDGLMYWANSLGFKKQSYRETLSAAAEVGTQCHNNIDAFLENGSHKEKGMNWQAQNAYRSFRLWYDGLVATNRVEVIYHEKTLTCEWFGGTLDGLYRINNKIYLIDYKTSNHITFNYCLQLAAYRYMLREVLGINIDGTVILQLCKTDEAFNEYVLNFDNINHLGFINDCERTFMSLVYAYYNLSYIEKQYNALNWGSISNE